MSNQTQNPPTLLDIVVMFYLKVPSTDTIRLLAQVSSSVKLGSTKVVGERGFAYKNVNYEYISKGE